ncbi:F-box/WD repeat-containing protein 7 (Archipelago homolog) (hAgo) (F-box and WD-40 domain-containing protein 7) (F-box protein FBX30) (SEL-10) (hCdc4), partial [Durusdinium trenchii]
RSNLLHRCTSIASDLTEHVAKVAASFSNGSVALLDFGPDVVAALSFPCSQREIEIKTSAITPNQRLCGTDEASPKHKQLLVGTEAGIATVWRMDRHLEDPCQWQAHSVTPSPGRFAGISAVGIGNQELFTGGADGSMCIWSQPGRSGDRLLRKIPAHGGAVTCVESAGPAQAFSAGEDGYVRYWSAEVATPSSMETTCDAELPLHNRDCRERTPQSPIYSMCVDRRLSRVLAGAEDGCIRLWDTMVWRPTKRSPHISASEEEPPSLTAVRFNTGEAFYHEFVSGAADGSWCLWDLREAQPVNGAKDPEKSKLMSVALHGARLLTCAENGLLVLWDLRANKVLRKVAPMDGQYLRRSRKGSGTQART